MRVRDMQRSKVYDYEAEVLRPSDDSLSLVECEDLIQKAWVLMIPPDRVVLTPKVADGRRRRSGMYRASTHTIFLPKYARVRHYVLHEVAHAILHHTLLEPHKVAWHGPEWCAVYVKLLERLGGWIGVRSSMRSYGIKIARGA